MNEQKNKQNHEESPKNLMGESVAPKSSWKKLLSKRWIYPAAYMAAAAIILTLVWFYQDASKKPVDHSATTTPVTDNAGNVEPGVAPVDPADTATSSTTGKGEDAVTTTSVNEDYVWPVAKASDVTVVKPFFDKDASEEVQEAAMIEYKDEFVTNDGIDVARSDKQAFDVKAALGGKVTHVEQHPLNGYSVEVTTASNLKSVYESLADVQVKQGDEVKQGDKLATSGQNEIGKDLGNHLHFAVYENNQPVNPEKVLPKQ